MKVEMKVEIHEIFKSITEKVFVLAVYVAGNYEGLLGPDGIYKTYIPDENCYVFESSGDLEVILRGDIYV